MAEMLDTVSNDIKEAMKKQEKAKLDALRYLKSMLIENKTAKQPKPELDCAVALAKKLKDSANEYPEGHEQRTKLLKEVEFLAPYLPQQLDELAVQKIIDDIVARVGKANAGMIMKELSPQIKGKFDGKRANEMVQKTITT